MERPIVYQWKERDTRPEERLRINTDNIIEVAEWCKNFGVNRLDNDVALPLERCVVGCYQIGYLFDYLNIKEQTSRTSYLQSGVASILIHLIASYEMMKREYIGLISASCSYTWWEQIEPYKAYACYEDSTQHALYLLSESAFKYQRWLLYNHMHRTKRWDEKAFMKTLANINEYCFQICAYENIDLGFGFALEMSKLQDGEIKRH